MLQKLVLVVVVVMSVLFLAVPCSAGKGEVSIGADPGVTTKDVVTFSSGGCDVASFSSGGKVASFGEGGKSASFSSGGKSAGFK